MITSISPNLYHMQVPAQQGKLPELSEPQKEVWNDFQIENKSIADFGGEDRTSESMFLPSHIQWNLFSFNKCGCGSPSQDTNIGERGASVIDKDNKKGSEPVDPLKSINASDLIEAYPNETPIVTIPEGEPVPFELSPERQPVFDPAIQPEEKGLSNEKNALPADEDDLMTAEYATSDRSFHSVEDRMPELILDAAENSNSQMVENRASDSAEMAAQETLAAIAENPDATIDELIAIWGSAIEADDGSFYTLETALKMASAETLLAAKRADSLEDLLAILDGESATEPTKPLDLDGINQQAKRTDVASEIISDSTTEKIVNYASELLSDDSPLTVDWLSKHLGVARLISAFPEFASYLNENSDLAIDFMKSLEEVKSTLADFFNKNAVEKASEFLSDDSPITDEWLAENISAAHLIANRPAFAAYLSENIEQAEKFISLSA